MMTGGPYYVIYMGSAFKCSKRQFQILTQGGHLTKKGNYLEAKEKSYQQVWDKVFAKKPKKGEYDQAATWTDLHPPYEG